MRKLITIAFGLYLIFPLYSQDAVKELTWDPNITKERKNVVRWNLTPFSLFGTQNMVFGMERVIAPHQTISLNLGRLKFRPILDIDLTEYNINSEQQGGGYSVAIDYRRYFKKRNRGLAPDGLYWGPYLVYYQYGSSLGFSHYQSTTNSFSNAEITMNIQVAQLGVELGYQFIIAKRLAIDLILVGPGGGLFAADFKVDGNLNIDEENEVIGAIYDKVVARIPGLEKLIEDKEFDSSGSYRSGLFGLRYVIQIGVLF